MTFQLDAFNPAPVGIDGEMLVGDGRLTTTWRVSAPPDLSFPSDPAAEVPGTRSHGLWEHTCFELFLRRGHRYIEVNISPGRDWNCYAFAGERTGMVESDDVIPIAIRTAIKQPSRQPDCQPSHQPSHHLTYQLTCELRHNLQGPHHIGICAVLEVGTDRHYLALHHPTASPDFHHPDGHVLTTTL